MVEPGTILLGKYRVERVIGRGGMGEVVLAQHLDLEQPVAIKMLLKDALDSTETVRRFLREAQAAVRLKSEHVSRIYDVGKLDTGAPYMVMEYLDGVDLGHYLHSNGPLEPGLAVDLMLQACEALAEAHANGIVHRDIKPSNFFLTRRPDRSTLLKVLDFGISKAPVHVDMGMTSTQTVMGTPSYMSPEQMRSTKHVDARSDIWSLGVVLYELLCGERPFEAETFSALCLKVAMDPTPPMPRSLPPGLSDVVMRCLAKEPSQRFQNMAELAGALAPYVNTSSRASSYGERVAGVLGVSSSVITAAPTLPSRPNAVPLGPPSTIAASAGQLTPQPSTQRRRKGLMIALAGGAVAVTAALVLVLGSGSGSADSQGETPVPASEGSQAVPAATAPAAATPSVAAPATATPDQPAATQAAPAAGAQPTHQLAAGAADAGVPAAEQTGSVQAATRTGTPESQASSQPSKRGRRDRKGKDSKPASENTAQPGGGDDDVFGTRQ